MNDVFGYSYLSHKIKLFIHKYFLWIISANFTLHHLHPLHQSDIWFFHQSPLFGLNVWQSKIYFLSIWESAFSTTDKSLIYRIFYFCLLIANCSCPYSQHLLTDWITIVGDIDNSSRLLIWQLFNLIRFA